MIAQKNRKTAEKKKITTIPKKVQNKGKKNFQLNSPMIRTDLEPNFNNKLDQLNAFQQK